MNRVGSVLLCLQELSGSWYLIQKTFPLCSPGFRNPQRQDAPCRAGRLQECLRASCIRVTSSHQAKKWLVASCSWGRQRCLRSPYLFNSELEEHSLVLNMEMSVLRTSLEVITSQGKWFIELCIVHSFHILINRLNNKSLHFIVASSHNAKPKSLNAILNGWVIKMPVNCLSQ